MARPLLPLAGSGGYRRKVPHSASGSPAIRLVGACCPDCGARIHAMALETGPQLVNHTATWTTAVGHRRRCKAMWVAVAVASDLSLIGPFVTREEAEARLRHEVADWIARAMTSVAA